MHEFPKGYIIHIVFIDGSDIELNSSEQTLYNDDDQNFFIMNPPELGDLMPERVYFKHAFKTITIKKVAV